jgi:succinyl-diaminopimelate desuccinylase
MGENAIHKLGSALEFLSGYEPQEVEVDGLVYKESLNAVLINGGIATNVIADRAILTVNYRFAPSKTQAQAGDYVKSLFTGCEINIVDSAPGARPGLQSPEAKAFVAAVGTSVHPKYGWTDVARFSELGIPAVNYGPGDPNKAHADDESLPASQIYACETGLRNFLTSNL